MNKARTIADLMERGRAARMVGRERELAALEDIVVSGTPAIAYLHGPYGAGKSTLLAAFEAALAARGIAFIRVSGSGIEPQPDAVIAALATALDATGPTQADLGRALAAFGPPGVLMIDDVDALQLVATWLRRALVPSLPVHVRLVLAGRSPPPATWTSEYGELFTAMPLRPLTREAVAAMAQQAGLGGSAVGHVWDLSAGHPLTVRMAVQAARSGVLESADSVGDLADAILTGSGNPVLADIVEAASAVRRATPLLVGAMLDREVGDDFEVFAALPFVQRDREGYLLAEPVRRPLSERLAALEPHRYATLRLAAAKWITSRLETAATSERWRYMADLLHLVEHAQIRDAFFPPEGVPPPVEPAQRKDFDAILDIAETRAGADERHVIERWTQVLPHRFNVARGTQGEVLAFYVYARGGDALDALIAADPLLFDWHAHAEQSPTTGQILFLRQLLAAEPDEGGAAWAACTVDVKRAYFERWDLSRVYTAARREIIEGPLMRRLGFQPLTWPRDGVPGSMVLDLRGGLIGWISGLVGAAVAPRAAADLPFARDRREVTVDGAIVQLTRLEADVLALLIDRAPAVVTRDELIEKVWRRAVVGSNVVDAVVRTLRRKLGSESKRIGTVPKAGYRYIAGI